MTDDDFVRALRDHADEHLDQFDALTWEAEHGRVWVVIDRRKPEGYDGLWQELPDADPAN